MAQNEKTNTAKKPAAKKTGGSASAPKKSGNDSKTAKPAAEKKTSSGTRQTAGASKSGTRSSGSSGSSGGAAKTKAAQQREEELRREEALDTQRRNVISLVMFAFSIIFLILVLFPEISATVSPVVYGLFGGCAIVWAAAFFAVAAIVSRSGDDEKTVFKCRMAAYLSLVISAFVHCASPVSNDVAGSGVKTAIQLLYTFGEARRGAGVVGGLLGAVMVRIFGRVLSMIIIVMAAFIVVMLLSQMTLPQLGSMIAGWFRTARDRVADFADDYKEAVAEREARRITEDTDYSGPQQADAIEDVVLNEINSPTAAQYNSRHKYSVFDIDDIDLPAAGGAEEGDSGAQTEAEESDKRRRSRVRTFGQVDPAAIDRHAGNVEEEVGDGGTLTEIPDFIADDSAIVTDEQLEELCDRVASESMRQHEEDMLAGAEEFEAEMAEAEDDEPIQYRFPSVTLLTAPEEADNSDLRGELISNADRLIGVLAEYKVSAKVQDIKHGPTVTRYEITPDTGVRIKKITELSGEMALRLAAKSVRIERPERVRAHGPRQDAGRRHRRVRVGLCLRCHPRPPEQVLLLHAGQCRRLPERFQGRC